MYKLSFNTVKSVTHILKYSKVLLLNNTMVQRVVIEKEREGIQMACLKTGLDLECKKKGPKKGPAKSDS